MNDSGKVEECPRRLFLCDETLALLSTALPPLVAVEAATMIDANINEE